MDKKIKIAICLSGEPRNTMASFPYIYENFLNLDPNLYQIDTYSYSFNSFRALPMYNFKKHIIDTEAEADVFNKWFFPIEKKFTPECLNQIVNTSNRVITNQSMIQNIFLMWYNIKNCWDLIQEKYDIYIRLRYDLVFPHPIPTEYFIQQILNNKTDIIIPGDEIEYSNKFCDFLAIGNYKSMSYYSNMINNLLNLMNKYNNFYPEYLLQKHLNSYGDLKINLYPFSLSILRKSYIHAFPKFNFLNE
tara:strand:+ start:349 stop:1089 length:741 start_codon:yes stop_codon:yes gene_type:complete